MEENYEEKDFVEVFNDWHFLFRDVDFPLCMEALDSLSECVIDLLFRVTDMIDDEEERLRMVSLLMDVHCKNIFSVLDEVQEEYEEESDATKEG